MSIFWDYEEEWANMRLLVFHDDGEGWIVQCETWVVERYIVFHSQSGFSNGARAALYGRTMIFNALKNELNS